MTDLAEHDHDLKVEMFGECPYCAAHPPTPVLPPRRDLDDPLPWVGGDSYEPDVDAERLSAQACRVVAHMAEGEWRTLGELAELTGDPEASISARLRAFRRPELGGWDVDRRRRPDGAWEYRLSLPRA